MPEQHIANKLTSRFDAVNSKIDNHPVTHGFMAVAAAATLASNAFVGMMHSAAMAGIPPFLSLPFAGVCALVLACYSFRVVMIGMRVLAEQKAAKK